MTKIIGIMAATKDGVIGNGKNLPWDYPDELNYFREITKNQIIVMGRKTFEIIPKKFFNNRIPIIFSHIKNPNYPTIHNISEFLSLTSNLTNQKIFMIGGAEIAHLFLQENLIAEFLLTQIHHPYPGDVYLNLKLFINWPSEIVTSCENYTIIRFKNKDKHAN